MLLEIKLSNTYYLQGLEFFEKKCYDKAIPLFKEAILANPELSGPYFYLAKSYFLCKKKSKAKTIHFLEKFLQFNKNKAENKENIAFAYDLLGRCFQDLEENAEAQKYYEQALLTDAKCSSAWNDLGLLHIQLGLENLPEDLEKSHFMFQEAFSCLKKAVAQSPTNPIFWHSLASAHEHFLLVIEKRVEKHEIDESNRGKHFKKAISYYKESLSLCESEDLDLDNTTLILSLPELKEAVKTNFSECLALYGHSFYKAKKYSKARELYRQTLEIDPQHVIAMNQIGMTFFEQKKYPEARTYFFAVLENLTNEEDKADAWLNITYTYQSENYWVFPNYGNTRH